ncbi:MAG: penicillin-binding transpeptidase domain-containing protein, partial [Verrucomicrobiota bacterium]
NIAVSDVYQPGSTFKLVAFGAAFDRNLANPSTPINCHNGHYDLENFVMKDHYPYGNLSTEMVFAKSSNIGAYMVARPLNRHVFHYYMQQFGFGRKSGIQLTAEHGGQIYPVSKWNATSFSSKVIGYEVMVTPLQMAMAANVVANDGAYVAPTVVKGVKNPATGKWSKETPIERVKVISERAAYQVQRCMVSATSEGGTGTLAAIDGYSVAGKTGTARKHVENVGYVEGRYVVSFVGFLPAENPELLGLVMIDDPRSEELNLYGGSVAAPAFRRVAEGGVKLLGIKPDLDELSVTMTDLSEPREVR